MADNSLELNFNFTADTSKAVENAENLRKELTNIYGTVENLSSVFAVFKQTLESVNGATGVKDISSSVSSSLANMDIIKTELVDFYKTLENFSSQRVELVNAAGFSDLVNDATKAKDTVTSLIEKIDYLAQAYAKNQAGLISKTDLAESVKSLSDIQEQYTNIKSLTDTIADVNVKVGENFDYYSQKAVTDLQVELEKEKQLTATKQEAIAVETRRAQIAAAQSAERQASATTEINATSTALLQEKERLLLLQQELSEENKYYTQIKKITDIDNDLNTITLQLEESENKLNTAKTQTTTTSTKNLETLKAEAVAAKEVATAALSDAQTALSVAKQKKEAAQQALDAKKNASEQEKAAATETALKMLAEADNANTAAKSKAKAAQEAADAYTKAEKEVQKAEESTTDSTKEVGEAFTAADAKATVLFNKVIDLAVKAANKIKELATEVINLGAEFEYNIQKAETLSQGLLSTDALDAQARSLATEYAQDVSSMANSMYNALSSSISPDDLFDFEDLASKLSVGGSSTVDTVTEGLVSVINAYHLEASEFYDLANSMLLEQDYGRVTLDELASNIGQVASVAQIAGVSVDDMLASVAAISSVTGNASETMTQLSGVINAVVGASDSTKEAAAGFGIDFSTSAIKSMGFSNWLTDLRDKIGDNEDALTTLFSNVRAFKGVSTLISDTGQEIFDKYIDATASGTDKISENYNKFIQTTQYKMDTLQSYIQNLNLSLFDSAKEPVKDLLDYVADAVSNVTTYLSSELGSAKVTEAVETITAAITRLVDEITQPETLDEILEIITNIINILADNGVPLLTNLLKIIEVFLPLLTNFTSVLSASPALLATLVASLVGIRAEFAKWSILKQYSTSLTLVGTSAETAAAGVAALSSALTAISAIGAIVVGVTVLITAAVNEYEYQKSLIDSIYSDFENAFAIDDATFESTLSSVTNIVESYTQGLNEAVSAGLSSEEIDDYIKNFASSNLNELEAQYEWLENYYENLGSIYLENYDTWVELNELYAKNPNKLTSEEEFTRSALNKYMPEAIKQVREYFTATADVYDVLESLQAVTEDSADSASDSFDSITDAAQDAADGVTDAAQDAADGVTDAAQDAADGVTDSAQDAADAVEGIVKATSDNISDIVEDTLTAYKRAQEDAETGQETIWDKELKEFKRQQEKKLKEAKQYYSNLKDAAKEEYNAEVDAIDAAARQREYDEVDKDIADTEAKLAKYGDYASLLSTSDRKAYKSLLEDLQDLKDKRDEMELKDADDAAKDKAKAEYDAKVEEIEAESDAAIEELEQQQEDELDAYKGLLEKEKTEYKRMQEDNYTEFKRTQEKIKEDVKAGVEYIYNTVTGELTKVVDSVLSSWDTVIDKLNSVTSTQDGVLEHALSVADKLKTKIEGISTDTGNLLKDFNDLEASAKTVSEVTITNSAENALMTSVKGNTDLAAQVSKAVQSYVQLDLLSGKITQGSAGNGVITYGDTVYNFTYDYPVNSPDVQVQSIKATMTYGLNSNSIR